MFLWLLTTLCASAGEFVKVRVADLYTRLPIAKAELALQLIAARGPTNVQKIVSSPLGNFEIQLTNKTATYQFEVKADDYSTYQSPRFNSQSALPFYDLTLERQKPFEGVIIAPTGQLASGAAYFLCTTLTEVTFKPDRTFFTRSRPPDLSGADARFRLYPETTGHSILVAHDLGFACVSLVGWTNGSRIQLKPWASVAGRLLVNGQFVTNQQLALHGGEYTLGSTKMTLLNFRTTTDANGRFSFENVPPGDLYLSWVLPIENQRLMYSHRTRLTADSAESREITLDFKGRNIAGKFAPKPAPAVDWKQFRLFAFISTKPLELPLELWRPDSGVTAPGQAETFSLFVNDSLSFKATAIPSGEYTLRFTAFDEPESGQPRRFDFQTQIKIPPGDGPLDLGAVDVTNRVVAR